MQAIYEVRLTVDPEIQAAFLEWMGPHMETVVRLGGFVKANLYREENAENVWVAQYLAANADVVHKYMTGAGQEMRADALARFGNKFRAERRILVSTT